MKIEDGILQGSADELAEMVGLSARRIQQLETAGTIAAVAHGVYDIWISVRGYCEFLRGSSRGSTGSAEQKAEQIRLTKAKAGLAELEHGQRIGELILKSVTRRQDFALGRILKSNLESVADRIAAIVAAETDPDKVHEIITSEIRNSQNQVIEAMSATEVDSASLDITRAKALESGDNETESKTE